MTELATVPEGGGLPATFAPAQIQLIKDTVARGATDDELQLFLHFCKASGFDPLRKQAYFQKRRQRQPGGGYREVAVFFAGIDGFRSRAARAPDFRGIMSGVVKAGDHFEADVANGSFVHRFGAKRGAIIGAWAVAKRSTHMPYTAFVEFNEYVDANNPSWKKMPGVMIEKCVCATVLRRAYPDVFGQLYEPAEFPRDQQPLPAPTTAAMGEEFAKGMGFDDDADTAAREKLASGKGLDRDGDPGGRGPTSGTTTPAPTEVPDPVITAARDVTRAAFFEACDERREGVSCTTEEAERLLKVTLNEIVRKPGMRELWITTPAAVYEMVRVEIAEGRVDLSTGCLYVDADGPAEPAQGDAAAEQPGAAAGYPDASAELAARFATEYEALHPDFKGPKLKGETERALGRLGKANQGVSASQLLAALVDGLVDLDTGKIEGGE